MHYYPGTVHVSLSKQNDYVWMTFGLSCEGPSFPKPGLSGGVGIIINPPFDNIVSFSIFLA